VEVTKGLMNGERIVISGTFLVDSESRMKAAARGIFGASAEDPVCGMQVDEKRAAAAGRVVSHGGRTYYFCADDCKRSFEKNPSRYLKDSPAEAAGHATHAPVTAAAAQAETAKDPICNMTVRVKDAVAAGLTSERDGRTYYFCAEQCKKTFDARPHKR
jgi:YHS domain-containing protein